jgi:hypothetical protein
MKSIELVIADLVSFTLQLWYDAATAAIYREDWIKFAV